MPPWRVESITGDVAAFHARPAPADSRVATFFRATSKTLVLGSAQRTESVDADSAARQGIEVVRRRSGGGGVLLWPDEFVWLDLVIPASDELWHDDVARAMWWVGDLWCEALTPFAPHAEVHRGAMQQSRWSREVCFAGVGPGEVLSRGAKMVGISQRRTRVAARFQTMVHLRWRPDVVASLIAAPPNATPPSTTELAALVATCAASAEEITASLAAALSDI